MISAAKQSDWVGAAYQQSRFVTLPQSIEREDFQQDVALRIIRRRLVEQHDETRGTMSTFMALVSRCERADQVRTRSKRIQAVQFEADFDQPDLNASDVIRRIDARMTLDALERRLAKLEPQYAGRAVSPLRVLRLLRQGMTWQQVIKTSGSNKFAMGEVMQVVREEAQRFAELCETSGAAKC